MLPKFYCLEEFPAKLENKLEPTNIYETQCVENEYKNTEKIIESKIEEIYLSDNGTINNVCETLELVHSRGEDPKTVPREYFCFVCNYQSTKKDSLRKHCRIHSNKKAYHCSLCDYKSSQRDTFESHLNIHVIQRNFKCSICEYRAVTLKRLNSHIRIKHGPNTYLCGVCDYKTSYKSNLYLHIGLHIEERRHSCNVCGYKTFSLKLLNTHMIIHGEKRIICYICGYKTAHKGNMTSHVRKWHETGVGDHMKQYECIFCVYKHPHIRCRAKE